MAPPVPGIVRAIGTLAALVFGAAVSPHADATTPQVIEFPSTLTGIPLPQYTAVAGDRVWIAGRNGQASVLSCVDRRTRQKCSATLPIFLRDAANVAQTFPAGLVIGPGGFPWVVHAGNQSVSRVDPATLAVLTVPTGGNGSQGICVGADGDIWVANVNSNTLSRLDPNTGLNRPGYPRASGAPSQAGSVIGPTQCVAGADGDIWATVFDGRPALPGFVTRLRAADGSVAPGFPVTSDGDPKAVATGADGDVYVLSESSLMRYDGVGGAVRPGYPRFVSVTPPPQGIARGADGHLWFSRTIVREIGRFDPQAGQVAMGFPFAIDAEPYGLAFDSDGNAWVATQGTNPTKVLLLAQPPLFADGFE
jgi:virginiamycin B lyase